MTQLRILKDTYDELKTDLARVHPHAAERVGFAFVRPSGYSTLIVTGYLSIQDEHYLIDDTVGARINHKAIAMAMKRADHNKEGILHVHEHGGSGVPNFSRTDLSSHPDLLRSFRNANPNGTHGFLLLSQNKLLLKVWYPEQSIADTTSRYTIVGLPFLSSWRGRLGL